MNSSVEPMFRPFTVNGLTLANRVVMAPMTRSKSPGGIPGPDVAAYYRRRAESEVGLILTEGTLVDHPVSSGRTDNPNFFGTALDGWRRVVEEVHAAGGRIMPQLWHVGIARDSMGGRIWNPEQPSVSPSGLSAAGPVGEPMSRVEIAAIVDAFARGAHEARALGFDGVELHGAHGYLVDQFFWDRMNRRDDAYGGDIERRARFAVEIIEAVRREVGPDYPVLFRFSQWKIQDYEGKIARDPDELGRFLRPLSEAGVDLFHCSMRRFWQPEFDGSDLNLAGWTKRLTGKPTMAVGSVGLVKDVTTGYRGESSDIADFRDLFERLDRDEFDLIAVGRALLVDPNWVRKVREGRVSDLLPFNPAAYGTLS
jgi:2,4-dienoyl-CoA reductase-like NADH-dependent reductase (Old Yellow Enzyme family)